MTMMLCSTCGSNAHSSRDCPHARHGNSASTPTRVAVANSATGNNVAAGAARDIAPYDACIRSLQRCLAQLQSELDDQAALRAQIKKVDQALKVLRGGVIVSSVAVDVPDVPERQGGRQGPRSDEAREAQSKRMKDYWAARRQAKVTA